MLAFPFGDMLFPKGHELLSGQGTGISAQKMWDKTFWVAPILRKHDWLQQFAILLRQFFF
jgi:hypothetical protein